MAYTTINKPTDYFNTKLYTGTGATQSITGVGFQPDFVWLKGRTGTAYYHQIFDAIRGTTKALFTPVGNAEETVSGLTAFGSDGFTVGSSPTVNGNNIPTVSWNWLGANGTSANTDGSISSTVSANTTSGFSIVSFTGTGANATVGHGLGSAPKMMIFKTRDSATAWVVYHKSVGATKGLFLNTTGTGSTVSAYFQDTDPTSSVFSVGSDADTNNSSSPMIAYCFADVQGYSKFGSYTGNGSTDGTFVYTGFKPAMVIIKRTNTAANWVIFDNKRGAYNSNSPELQPNTSAVEAAVTDRFDFVSNGIKFRSSSYPNGSGNSFIYMAFAEQPLVGDNPATAR
jgi:hypothetical protein